MFTINMLTHPHPASIFLHFPHSRVAVALRPVTPYRIRETTRLTRRVRRSVCPGRSSYTISRRSSSVTSNKVYTENGKGRAGESGRKTKTCEQRFVSTRTHHDAQPNACICLPWYNNHLCTVRHVQHPSSATRTKLNANNLPAELGAAVTNPEYVSMAGAGPAVARTAIGPCVASCEGVGVAAETGPGVPKAGAEVTLATGAGVVWASASGASVPTSD